MKLLLKRLGAYFIDYLVVNIIIYGVMLLPFINLNKEEYNTKYNEIIQVNEQFQNNEISSEEFNEALVPIAYDLYRLNVSYVVVSTVCFIGYFVFFQFLNKGQTIGKKLCKLRVKGINDKQLTLANFLVRALILYNILIPIFELIIVYVMSADTYYPVYQNINLVSYIILYITLFVMLVRQDGRGLHDLLANTIVLDDALINQVEEAVIVEKDKNIKDDENSEKNGKKVVNDEKTQNKKKKTKASEK